MENHMILHWNFWFFFIFRKNSKKVSVFFFWFFSKSEKIFFRSWEKIWGIVSMQNCLNFRFMRFSRRSGHSNPFIEAITYFFLIHFFFIPEMWLAFGKGGPHIIRDAELQQTRAQTLRVRKRHNAAENSAERSLCLLWSVCHARMPCVATNWSQTRISSCSECNKIVQFQIYYI